MSIIEKAVGRFDASGKKGFASRKRTGVGQHPSPGAVVFGSKSGRIVRTDKVDQQGLPSIISDPAIAQDFRFLKRPVLSRIFRRPEHGDNDRHRVLVTSDLPGAGKSFVSFNLAASMAQEQMVRVILVDADPLRHGLTTTLGLQDEVGLLEVLADEDRSAESVALPTDLPGMWFIPAGQPREGSTELLASKRMLEFLDELDDPDTVVLLDSPPMLLTAEARVLVEAVRHTLVIIEAGRTSASDVAAILKMLGQAGSSVSFVLNKAARSEASHDAGYRYGYQYGY